jgi:hypothetical protein
MTTYRTPTTERLVQDWTLLVRQACLTLAYQPAGVIDALTVVQPAQDLAAQRGSSC